MVESALKSTGQETLQPRQKVLAATAGSAIGVILIWLAESLGGMDVPEAVELAITTLTTFALGWIVPPGVNETTVA